MKDLKVAKELIDDGDFYTGCLALFVWLFMAVFTPWIVIWGFNTMFPIFDLSFSIPYDWKYWGAYWGVRWLVK